MSDYKELIKKSLEALSYAEQINPNTFYLTRADLIIIYNALEQLVKERDELRNELCLRCGEYTEAHNGACDGCRWKVN